MPGDCNCPDSCKTTAYSQDLSYSKLSEFSVNHILQGSRTEQISASYIEAVEMWHRLDPDELISTINNLMRLRETFYEILVFLNEKIKQSDASRLQAIKKAMLLFAEHAKSSITDQLTNIQSIQSEYENEEQNSVQQLEFLYSIAAAHLTYLDQYLDMENTSLIQEQVKIIVFDLQSLKFSLARAENKQSLPNKTLHLPGKLTVARGSSYEDCSGNISSMIKHVNKLYEILHEKWYFEINVTSAWMKQIRKEKEALFLKGEYLRNCLQSFPSSLDKVMSYRENAVFEMDTIIDNLSSDTKLLIDDGLYERAENIYQRYEQLLYNYSSGITTKKSLSNAFQQNKISSVLSQLYLAVAVPTKLALNNLREHIQEMQYVFVHLFNTGIGFVAKLDQHYPKSIIKDSARSMDILRAPIPELDYPEIYILTLRKDEIWKSWPAHLSLTEFYKSMAHQMITKLCDGYFDVLIKELDDITTKYDSLHLKVGAALENMTGHMKKFSDAILMEEKFIM